MLAITDEGQHDVRGVLIYDTHTGQHVKSLETERPVRIAEFHGPYVFTKVVDLYPAYWKDMVEKPISMAEGHPVFDAKRGVTVKLPEGFTHHADKSVNMEAHPTDRDWVYLKSHPKLVDMDAMKAEWRYEYTLLQRVDDRFVMQSRFTVPKTTQLHWMGQGQLLAGWAGNEPAPSFLTDLAKKHAWVKSVVEAFWPVRKPSVVVYGPNGDLRYRFDDAVYVNPVWSRSQGTSNIDPTRFVIVRNSRGDQSYTRIECYSLPNSFYSLWWARSLGIVVAMLLLALLLWRGKSHTHTRNPYTNPNGLPPELAHVSR